MTLLSECCRHKEEGRCSFLTPERATVNSQGASPWCEGRAIAPSPEGATETRQIGDSVAPSGLMPAMFDHVPGAHAPGY